ncbi:MAG: hypothetical protein RLZZ54_166 [Cyanobacteriota bacterium]
MSRVNLLWLLSFGLLIGLVEWPYQALSELGFALQRALWPLPGVATAQDTSPWRGVVVVFASTVACLVLAWGPLSPGRGGGVAPVIALDRSAAALEESRETQWLGKLSLRSQLIRLPLVVLTHLGGLSVGVESPSAALGASVLLAIRRRWPQWSPLAAMPLPLVGVIGGAAGLGAAFRSPLLGVVYGVEELGRRSGLPLVVPALLMAGTGALVNSRLGQPARLPGLQLGSIEATLWPWIVVITLIGAVLGGVFVRLLIALAAVVQRGIKRRRVAVTLAIATCLSLLALISGGLSLNDGSLSLGAALQGSSGGPPFTLLWRWLASLLSIAAGAPGGLMHDVMTLGSLLPGALAWLPPLAQLSGAALAQLAAVGATALFAGANGTPIFCAVFVFTLQGDPQLFPVLLLVSAVSEALAAPLRGEGWNEQQSKALMDHSTCP